MSILLGLLMVGAMGFQMYNSIATANKMEGLADAQAKFQGEIRDRARQAGEEYELIEYDGPTEVDLASVEAEFQKVYEGVILPNRIDFEENVIPKIQQAFSSPAFGEASLGGVSKLAEAGARQAQSSDEARIRFAAQQDAYEMARQDLERQITVHFENQGVKGQQLQNILSELGLESGSMAQQGAFEAGAIQAKSNAYSQIASTVGGVAGAGFGAGFGSGGTSPFGVESQGMSTLMGYQLGSGDIGGSLGTWGAYDLFGKK